MEQTKSSRRGWKRRLLSFVMAAVMVLGLVPGFPGADSEASAHWADPYLSQLVEWGFIRADQSGYPDRALTRADFMAIVNRAYGYATPGETPFEDVNENDWYYDDVNIAYNARYIKGTSPTTASPKDPLTRETAATILGRNMMLQDSAGEILDFTDARRISNWAKGTIKSSLEHYLVSGYNDGTFRPQRNVSWGEMASMISKIVGTPLQEPGDYALGGTFGNVTITSPGVTLRDTVVSGDLYITGGVGLGNVKLENVTVLGRIICSGTGASEGGEASILLRNVTADEMLIDNLQDNKVSIKADGITQIGRTTVRTSAYIEDNTPEGMGLQYISIEGDFYPEGEEPEGWEPIEVDLAGRIGEVVNRTPGSQVRAAKGTIAKLTVDEAAVDSTVIIDRGAVVKELNLDTATLVTGEGDIEHLIVNAPGCEVEMLPDKITIRPGITAIINGEEMDSVAAEESSMEPLILAGYPEAQDITPTGLLGAFMTNKSGTVYWAVSPITEGSVGEEDLIKPPSYGSIAVARGSVKAPKGNEEFTTAISGLTPGGSYYLSAVLVDARDHRSPVKVISFTTPDNTIPAFCAGYPHMSKVSPKDSVAVVMPTKDCKLYYALLPQGAVAPTVDEMKTNAVAGALGYGVRDVYKNTEDAFRVNDVTLEEKTTYVLYFFLTDGVNNSPVTSLTFTTDDETPPEFIIHPYVVDVKANSVGLSFRLNEDGIVYWVAVPAGTVYPKPEPGTDDLTAPLTSDYAKLQVSSGMNIGTNGKAGQVNCRENVDGTINVNGLKPETAYDFYYVAKDTAGPDRNYSLEVKKITINTLDETGPKFSQSFSKVSGTDKTQDPMSNTDIYMDVSEDIRYTGEGGGQSFLELYQNTLKGTEADKKAAINKLAANLFNSIVLHKVSMQDNSEETIVRKRDLSYTKDDWVIDYTKATIVSLPTGGIRITFPSEGLHLENGGRYYFTIENVTDMSNSFNEVSPNPVDFFRNQATSAANGHNVPVFVVEFARVDLSSPGVGATDGPIVDATATDNEKKFARVDMSFRMTPVSTETVGDIISYDVLLWTDSQLKFDLYYRVVDQGGQKISDENGNYPETFTFKDPNTQVEKKINKSDYLLPHLGTKNASTTPDANGWINLGNSSDVNPTSGQRSGRSVNKYFNGCGSTSFPKLNKLSSDLRYEFVIHLTSLGDIEEKDASGTETWKNWNGEVKFYVNVAAGQSNNLDNLAGSLTTENWETAKKRDINGGARSIGRWYDYSNNQTDTQELSRLFTDSRLPRFEGGSPLFPPDKIGATSITVTLQMSSAGTLYYALGKADTGGTNHVPEITTTRKLMEGEDPTASNLLREGNDSYYIRLTDGTVDTMTGIGSLAPPEHGGEQAMPKWMCGTEATYPTDTPEQPNLVLKPQANWIFNPGSQAETAAAITGSYAFKGRVQEPMTIEGLEPETDYFAYFVIKGAADTLSHVYIYHFKTPKASKPKIDLGLYTEGEDKGGATIKTDIDSKLNYFVFTLADARNKIPILSETITVSDAYARANPDLMTAPGANTMTILNALLQTYMGEDTDKPSSDYYGFSVFDVYAPKDLKTRMSNFLHGRFLNTFLGTVKPVDRSDSELDMKGNVTKNELLEISKGTDYVILAVSHVPEPNSTDEAEYETYAGYAPLRLGAARPAEVDSWSANLTMGKPTDDLYQGSVRITFDSQLYSKEDGQTLLDNATITDASVTQNWIGDEITKRIDVNVDSSDPRQTTITFRGIGAGKGWRANDEIYIPGSKLFNANGIACTSNLTIRVSRTTTGMRITLRWDNGRPPQDFDFPYEVTQTEVTAYFSVTGTHPSTPDIRFSGSMGSQVLAVDSSIQTVDVKADLNPPESALNCQYIWSSSNSSVVEVTGSKSLTETLKIKGPGSATITLRIIGTDANGNEIDERRSFEVSVGGIELSNATNAGSAQNGSLVWDLGNDAGSTITIRSTQPLPASITANNVNIASQNGYFAKSSGQIIFNGPRTEVQIPITLIGAPPNTAKDVITVTIGMYTCEIPVTFKGSQSNLPIAPTP